MSNATATKPRPRPENLLLSLVCNIAIPTAILTWMSGDRWLGPTWGLVAALCFPVSYAVHDFITRRQWNFIAILGFSSVLITGTFGLMRLDVFWFAVKEASIPALIGLAVLGSMKAKRPLVHTFIYNPQVIDVERVDLALAEKQTRAEFDRMLRGASRLLALSFFLSSALNYGLARHLLRSAPGTEAFNGELGKMNLWSWPVIVVPSMLIMMLAIWRLIKGLQSATGLGLEQILRQPEEKK